MKQTGFGLRKIKGKPGPRILECIPDDGVDLLHVVSSQVNYNKIVATSEHVYVFGLANSFQSYTIHVRVLSVFTGEPINSAHVATSKITGGFDDFLVLTTSIRSPNTEVTLVWIDKKDRTVRFQALTPELDTKSSFYLKSAKYTSIVDVGLSESGQFMAIKEDGSGRAFRVVQGGKAMDALLDFPESVRTCPRFRPVVFLTFFLYAYRPPRIDSRR